MINYNLLPSLNNRFNQNQVLMSLTSAGLLIDRTESITKLYAKNFTWESTKKLWHEKRLSERGSRGSSQKIFSIIKRRLQAGSSVLPSVVELSDILSNCQDEQDKAQILFLYLLEFDVLVKYMMHELYRKYGEHPSKWDLKKESLLNILKKFEYEDGTTIEYSESTMERWIRGFRSLLYDIGFRKSIYADEGKPPMINDIPLSVSAYYSWKKKKRNWTRQPFGWAYLLQPPNFWEVLYNRVEKLSGWVKRDYQGRYIIEPKEAVFDFKEAEK